MDNQHRKISGYRELTQEEIDLINEAKALEAQVLALHSKVANHITHQVQTGAHTPEWYRADQAQAWRWLAIGKTDIETGFMALVRSIAQPQPRSLDE